MLLAAVPIGLALAAALALAAFSRLPQDDVNANRISPSVALAKGYAIYASADRGAIVDFMYGPVAALLFLPAALARSPSGTLLIGGLLNVALFFLPVAWLHLRGCRGATVPALAGIACFALLVFRDVGLRFAAFNIHVDAPALGLVACTCALVLPRADGGRRSLGPAAVLAPLAVWTKQPAAPLLVVLPLYVLLSDGRRAALRFTAWVVAAGVAMSIGFVLAFGYRELVFNMFTLPSRHPWYGEPQSGKLAAALASFRVLLRQNAWSAGILAALFALAALDAPSVRGRLRDRPWMLLLVVGVAMIPTSVLGGAKVGGFVSAHGFTSYFVLGAATLGLADAAARRASRMRWPAGLALSVLVVLLAGRALADPGTRRDVRTATGRLRAWRVNPQEEAYEVARRHPGRVFFPWNPLAALQGEGKLYHSEFGIFDRDLAGLPPGAEQLRRHLPRRLRFVAYRKLTTGAGLLPEPTAHVPGFDRRFALRALPGWTVYGRRT